MAFSTTVQRAPTSISGTDHVRVGLACPPHIEAAGNATRNQRPAGLEFWVPRVLYQDGIAIVDAVALPPLAADLGRLDGDAVRQRRHPFSWQAGVGRKRNNAT